MPLIRTNIYLDEKQLERLREKSTVDNIPVSEIVRRAVDAFLAWNDQHITPVPKSRKRNAPYIKSPKGRGFTGRHDNIPGR